MFECSEKIDNLRLEIEGCSRKNVYMYMRLNFLFFNTQYKNF